MGTQAKLENRMSPFIFKIQKSETFSPSRPCPSITQNNTESKDSRNGYSIEPRSWLTFTTAGVLWNHRRGEALLSPGWMPWFEKVPTIVGGNGGQPLEGSESKSAIS